jgi:hypothetical protein
MPQAKTAPQPPSLIANRLSLQVRRHENHEARSLLGLTKGMSWNACFLDDPAWDWPIVPAADGPWSHFRTVADRVDVSVMEPSNEWYGQVHESRTQPELAHTGATYLTAREHRIGLRLR